MQTTLNFAEFSTDARVAESIALLRKHSLDTPFLGAFSGGKDSVVIKQLALEAGVSVEWHYYNTTCDPPELVHFIQRKHPDVLFDMPRRSIFASAARWGPPTRRFRWCCHVYKERSVPDDAILLTGVRAEESSRRAKKWKTFQPQPKGGPHLLPIFSWTEADVWTYIESRALPYCSLYDADDISRIGCVGCPMASPAARAAEFARWPKIAKSWRRALDRWYDSRVAAGKSLYNLRSSDDLWAWWTTGVHPNPSSAAATPAVVPDQKVLR